MTLYQSEDPIPTVTTNIKKEDTRKSIKYKKMNKQHRSISTPALKTSQSHAIEYRITKIIYRDTEEIKVLEYYEVLQQEDTYIH